MSEMQYRYFSISSTSLQKKRHHTTEQLQFFRSICSAVDLSLTQQNSDINCIYLYCVLQTMQHKCATRISIKTCKPAIYRHGLKQLESLPRCQGIRSRIPQSPYFFGDGRLKDSQISHHTDVNNKVNICKRYPLKLHFISAKRHDSFRPNKTC